MDRVAVQDANILIDLERAQLLDVWFQLGIETHTTAFITRELRRGNHHVVLSYVAAGQIISHDLEAGEVAAMVTLQRTIGAGLSLNDCSVLYLAERMGALLLTGDGALREAGRLQRVPVHGTLWIMDQLVAMGLIGTAIAATKLEALVSDGRRLPKDACTERIERWRSAR